MQPLSELGVAGDQFQMTIAASERVFEFLEEAEEVPVQIRNTNIPKHQGEVVFKDVRFGYNPDKIIINNFSATIKPGQTVAIVGPTGAGKRIGMNTRLYIDLN